jgi:hypothetical protein
VQADQAGAGLWCSYIDGYIDTVFGFADPLVANEGPLYIGRDLSNPGIEGMVAGVDYSAAFLPPKEVGSLADISPVRVSVALPVGLYFLTHLCTQRFPHSSQHNHAMPCTRALCPRPPSQLTAPLCCHGWTHRLTIA